MAPKHSEFPYFRKPAVLFDRALRYLLSKKLSKFKYGRVALRDGVWCQEFGQLGGSVIEAHVEVHDSRAYRAFVLGGTIGAADAYASGWWSSDDLTALIRIAARNRSAVDSLDGLLSRVSVFVHGIIHRMHVNWRSQSRRNISAHYDLGNEFFSHFLDSSMMYSCAIFPSESATLEEASRYKIDRVCQKLKLVESDELLEIGTGWGSLAIHAAANYGCRVTTTTISAEQYRHAVAAVEQAGLEDRVTVLNVDYRDLPHLLDRQFDKLVSIEMLEAVGQRFLDRYFSVCDRLLKPGGMMVLQTIVIADELYETYRRSVDFIQRYIFPGGFLPSVSDIRKRLSSITGLSVSNIDDISDHYPRTLRMWRDRVSANKHHLQALGYSKRLLRLWEYYFCYSEGGFLERSVGDVQFVLTKRDAV